MNFFDVVIGLMVLAAVGFAARSVIWLGLFLAFPCHRCCGLKRYCEPGSWILITCQVCNGSGWKVRR